MNKAARTFTFLAFASILAHSTSMRAQGAEDEHDAMNVANNPTTLKYTVETDNYYSPGTFARPTAGYELNLKLLIPYKIGRWDQTFRAMLPMQTLATGPRSRATGLNDFQFMNYSLTHFMVGSQKVTFGIGPALTIPSGVAGYTGAGKWQLGPASIIVADFDWGLAAGILTYQTSVGGAQHLPGTSNISFQPWLVYNLPEKMYLRSSAIMNFNLAEKTNILPIGLGAGKIWTLADGSVLNLWVEPQLTVYHRGADQAKLQIYLGAKYQFGL